MGFIERLRRQKRQEEARAAPVAAKKAALDLAEQVAKRQEYERIQRWRQEAESHPRRQQYATIFFQATGIELLIAELGKRLGPSPCLPPRVPYYGRLDDPSLSTGITSIHRKLPSLAVDNDSIPYGILWAEREIGSRKWRHWTSSEVRTVNFEMIGHAGGGFLLHETRDVSHSESWLEFEGNFMAV